MLLGFRSTASWPLEPSKDEKQGWRYIRIQQNGKNASGQTHYLSLSGFEIYGTVTGVCIDLGWLSVLASVNPYMLFCSQSTSQCSVFLESHLM